MCGGGSAPYNQRYETAAHTPYNGTTAPYRTTAPTSGNVPRTASQPSYYSTYGPNGTTNYASIPSAQYYPKFNDFLGSSYGKNYLSQIVDPKNIGLQIYHDFGTSNARASDYADYIKSLSGGGGTTTPKPTTPATPTAPTRFSLGQFGDLDRQWQLYARDPDSFAPGTDMVQARMNFMNAGGYQMPSNAMITGTGAKISTGTGGSGWLGNLTRNIGGANSALPTPVSIR
jgi:hypothetical protein